MKLFAAQEEREFGPGDAAAGPLSSSALAGDENDY